MKTHQITFTEKNRAELLEAEIDDQLAPNQALVKGEHSVVSAGTEGAGFTGLVQQMPFGGGGSYPATTGYGHLGEVLEVGSAVTMCKPGRPGAEFFESCLSGENGRRTIRVADAERRSRREDCLRADGRR